MVTPAADYPRWLKLGHQILEYCDSVGGLNTSASDHSTKIRTQSYLRHTP